MKITEIIPDDLPEWAKQAMDDGQFFNVVSEKIKNMFTWTPIEDGLPTTDGIHMLTLIDSPTWDEGEAEEGKDVIIGVYQGKGKWRRRGIIYKAGVHVSAWSERPKPYTG